MALFQGLKNTAKTRGHRVSILSPQTPILPKPSPKKCPLFAEIDNFLVKNSTRSDSMTVTDDSPVLTYIEKLTVLQWSHIASASTVVTNRRDGDLSFELVDPVYQKEGLFSGKFFAA
jgi:hypothetical protein